MTNTHRPVVVLCDDTADAQLIARMVRDQQIFSQVLPPRTTVAQLAALSPGAVIIAQTDPAADRGDSAMTDPALFAAKLPVLAIGGAYQQLKTYLGNSSAAVTSEPIPTASDTARRLLAAQLLPRQLPDDSGRALLRTFLTDIAQVPADWTAENILRDQVAAVRERVGPHRLICGLSGGVDSAVAAAIVQKAVGDQLVCVFVDHGLLREGERQQVERDYVAATGVRLVTVDATANFLGKLAGITDPEQKRKIIGHEFIRTFEKAAGDLVAEDPAHPIKFLVQGTIYPDIVESITADGSVAVKSHHNVGGLPEDLDFALVEPLTDLFKDEVRSVGRLLGLPDEIVDRHPFPGPGLAVRMIGAITAERLKVLRAADAIVREELHRSGAEHQIWQCPVVLLADVRSVGVTDGARTYGMPVVLRPVLSVDAMTAQWARLDYELLDTIAARITAEVTEVTRVALDITNKPPGTIEWE